MYERSETVYSIDSNRGLNRKSKEESIFSEFLSVRYRIIVRERIPLYEKMRRVHATDADRPNADCIISLFVRNSRIDWDFCQKGRFRFL